jgi:uncharacterized protein (TIRG00374 family)
MTDMKKLFVVLFKLLVASLLLLYLQKNEALDLKQIAFFFENTYLIFLLWLGAIFYSALGGVRIFFLTNSFRIKTRIGDCLKLALVGNFFNYASLGTVGGDLVRVYYLGKLSTEKKTKLFTLIVIDRLIGLSSMLISGWIWLLFIPGKQGTILYLSRALDIFVVLFLGIILYAKINLEGFTSQGLIDRCNLRKKPVLLHLVKIFETCLNTATNLKLLAKIFSVTLTTNLIVCVLAYFISTKLDSPEVLNMLQVFAGTILGYTTTILPISPAGIGVGHLGFSYIFSELGGVKSSFGADLFSILVVIFFMASCVGGLIYVISPPKKP